MKIGMKKWSGKRKKRKENCDAGGLKRQNLLIGLLLSLTILFIIIFLFLLSQYSTICQKNSQGNKNHFSLIGQGKREKSNGKKRKGKKGEMEKYFSATFGSLRKQCKTFLGENIKIFPPITILCFPFRKRICFMKTV